MTYPALGLVALVLDNPDQATAMFEWGTRARGFDPVSALARRMSSELRAYLGESEVLARRSGDPGRVIRTRGEIHRVVPLYREMLVGRPCDLQASCWLGLILMLAERTGEARDAFSCVVERAPNSADARMVRRLERYLPHR